MSCNETIHANVDGSMLKSSQKEILLGINLYSELKFEDHAKKFMPLPKLNYSWI